MTQSRKYAFVVKRPHSDFALFQHEYTVIHAINDLTVHAHPVKPDKWPLLFARIEELFAMAAELYMHRWFDTPLSRRIVEHDGADAPMFTREAATPIGVPVVGKISAIPGSGGDSVQFNLEAGTGKGAAPDCRSSYQQYNLA